MPATVVAASATGLPINRARLERIIDNLIALFDESDPDLESYLGDETIYRKIKEGTFPAQLKISTNGAGWKESDINRWVVNPAGWRPRSRNEFDFLNDY